MYLRLCLFVLVGSLLNVNALGQTPRPANGSNGSEVYVLQLAELQFSTGNDLWAPEKLDSIDTEIGRLKSTGLLKDFDFIRATVLADEKTTLNYQRMISVVTGVTKSTAGTTLQTQWRDIGVTIDIAISAAEDNSVRAAINFHNSRATEDPEPEIPEIGPDILTTQCRTSLLLNLGETTIMSCNQDSCVLIRVEKH